MYNAHTIYCGYLLILITANNIKDLSDNNKKSLNLACTFINKQNEI